MNRRDFACRVFVLTTGAAALIAGCEKREERATIAPPPRPAESPLETPAQPPAPEPTPLVAETQPIEATPPADAPRQAPYGELSADQQGRVSVVMDALGEVNANEAKRWTENLAFDATGDERELRVWESIAQGFTTYSQNNPGVNEAAKQEAFNVILTASLVPAKHLLRYVTLSALSPTEAKAVAALYIAPVTSPPPTS